MILDTNALSAFPDNDRELLKVLPFDRPLYLPVVVIGEYRFGLKGSDKKAELETWLGELISALEILVVDEHTSVHYAEIRHELKLASRAIPPNDSWIGALARQHDLPIATRDRHFKAFTDLEIVSW